MEKVKWIHSSGEPFSVVHNILVRFLIHIYLKKNLKYCSNAWIVIPFPKATYLYFTANKCLFKIELGVGG